MSNYYISDLVDNYISGDWGNDKFTDETPCLVKCIRGADINNVNENSVANIPERYITQSGFNNKNLSLGDIVIEKSGGSPTQSTGRVAYISDGIKDLGNVVCSNFCTAFRIKAKWDSKYVYYYLKYIYSLNVFFNFEGKTSGIKNLQLEQAFDSIPIKFIDKKKQQQISKVLSDIDKKIEINNRIIQESESLVRNLYNYWFIQFDFPDANGKPYRASGSKMIYNEKLKREIPEGWEVKKISNWILSQKGGDWGKEESEGNYVLKVECIRGADINGLNGIGDCKAPIRYILQKNDSKLLEENDLIIEISGGSPIQSTGRIALITKQTISRFNNSLICSNFCQAVTLKDKQTSFFFYYMWKMFYDSNFLFNYEGKTSGIKNFLFESFVDYNYWYCPPKDLVYRFQQFSSKLYAQKENLLKSNTELASLRDFLLPMLMNGQVKVK